MSEDARIADSVRKHGWHGIAVEGKDREPSFFYTIGLAHSFGHPEIVVCGLDLRVMHALASDVVADIRTGKRFVAGETCAGIIEGYSVAFRDVHRTQCVVRLGYAMGFYRQFSSPERLTALQLFWPDEAGKFPFESGCDPEVVARQPRLDIAVPDDALRKFLAQYGRPTN